MERREETGREGSGLRVELILAHSMGGKTRVKLVKKQDRKQKKTQGLLQRAVEFSPVPCREFQSRPRRSSLKRQKVY